jgi:hypothetical protein
MQDRGSRGEAVGNRNGLAAAQKKQPIPAVFRRNGLQLTDPVHETHPSAVLICRRSA